MTKEFHGSDTGVFVKMDGAHAPAQGLLVVRARADALLALHISGPSSFNERVNRNFVSLEKCAQKPSNLNPKPPLNPKPYTLNPKPYLEVEPNSAASR